VFLNVPRGARSQSRPRARLLRTFVVDLESFAEQVERNQLDVRSSSKVAGVFAAAH
jgi:hypothetical protein